INGRNVVCVDPPVRPQRCDAAGDAWIDAEDGARGGHVATASGARPIALDANLTCPATVGGPIDHATDHAHGVPVPKHNEPPQRQHVGSQICGLVWFGVFPPKGLQIPDNCTPGVIAALSASLYPTGVIGARVSLRVSSGFLL